MCKLIHKKAGTPNVGNNYFEILVKGKWEKRISPQWEKRKGTFIEKDIGKKVILGEI